MSAIKFLERVSIPTDNDGDTTEDVSFSDAVYATKVAVLEFATELHGKEPNVILAILEDKIRQLKRDKIKIE